MFLSNYSRPISDQTGAITASTTGPDPSGGAQRHHDTLLDTGRLEPRDKPLQRDVVDLSTPEKWELFNMHDVPRHGELVTAKLRARPGAARCD